MQRYPNELKEDNDFKINICLTETRRKGRRNFLQEQSVNAQQETFLVVYSRMQ